MCEISNKDIQKILSDLKQIIGVLTGDEFHKRGLIANFEITRKRVDMIDSSLLQTSREVEILKFKIKEITIKNIRTNKMLRKINNIMLVGYGILGAIFFTIKFILPLILRR